MYKSFDKRNINFYFQYNKYLFDFQVNYYHCVGVILIGLENKANYIVLVYTA